MKYNSTAVVIAGGKSSRMQKDKALLPFGKYKSLAEYQCVRLAKIFEKVYLSAKSNKFNFEIRVLEDNYPISSPLVALISIFENLAIDEVFVLSVDAPFVDEKVIDALYNEAKDNIDVIVAKSPNGIEPLCAIYRRSFLTLAHRALEENNHRLHTLLNDLNVVSVQFEEVEFFTNLNYPFEYEKAKLSRERD